MIFETLQSEMFRFKIHLPSEKSYEIPEFHINMGWISEYFNFEKN